MKKVKSVMLLKSICFLSSSLCSPLIYWGVNGVLHAVLSFTVFLMEAQAACASAFGDFQALGLKGEKK